MTINSTMWWKQPRNRDWYRFITRWFLWGSVVICTWSFGCYLFYRLLIGNTPTSYVLYWHDYYTIWLVSCFVLVIVIPIMFFNTGLQYYAKSNLRITFSATQRIVTFVGVIVFLCLTMKIVFRPSQEPSIAVALFDLSLMPGLMGGLLGAVHIAITLVCRKAHDEGAKSDV